MPAPFDFCVIGGGIVGLATAMQILERRPGASLLLIEKEDGVARHQTGHNSGVVHAGIYYTPGSLKARLCREGLKATTEFCAIHAIPFEACGKLIVATSPAEEQRMRVLYERAIANGLKLEVLDGAELRRLEPAVTGTAALRSPETAMVSYTRVAEKMAELVGAAGGTLRFGLGVETIREGPDAVEIGAGGERFRARRLVVCAGLQSDRLARLAGLSVDFKIVPFRGEYYRLTPSRQAIVRHHIYPCPDPELPFLGIHLTRTIEGTVTVGPNAVIGLSREGYRKLAIDVADTVSFVSFPGFWKLIARNWRHAVHELGGSLFRSRFLAECRKYCPGLELSDLEPHPAGIRAQVVMADGTAQHDFLFKETDRMLHVCNAPSPAATSAIPIGAMIAQRVLAA